MKIVCGTMLGMALGIAAVACSAQDTTVPFLQMEQGAQWSASAVVPASEAAVSHSNGLLSASSSASGAVFVPPVYKAPRTLSKGFFLINGLHLGMALFDVGMTQHCIAVHHCQEGNPIMPSSVGGQLGVAFALTGYGTFISYRMKRNESRVWWLSPAIGVGAHTAGVATGFAHY